jgi:lysophospholipase L1-like esterase
MEGRVEKFAKQTGIFLILIFLWLAYVELVCFAKIRRANADTDIIPRTSLLSVYQGAPWVNTLADEWAPSNHYSYEAWVDWQRKPFQGQTINIDATGVRRSTPSHCDEKAYTIWVFGGSTVWGYGAPDWLTIPSQLAEKYEQAGRNVCVKNYGEKAWVTTQEMIKLILELKRGEQKPDLVIFYDGPADVWESYQSGRGGVHQNFEDTKRLFEGHAAAISGSFGYLLDTNTARLLLQQRLQNRMKQTSTKDTDAIARRAIRCYFENVRLVEALGREYGFEPLFFWEPTISTGNKHLTAEEAVARDSARQQTPGLDEANQAAYALLKAECRPPVFCIADVLDTITGTVYFDENHISAEGNRLIAERMYDTIQRQHH